MNIDEIKLDVSSSAIDEIVDQLNINGIVCLDNAISPAILDRFRGEVQKELKDRGDRYFSKINPADAGGSAFSILKRSNDFIQVMRKVASNTLNRSIGDDENLSVLRVITGKKAESQTLNFHYDAYALTALIPIFIPDGAIQESGHLVALLNSRKFRRYQIINIIEKFIIQNRITSWVLSVLVRRNESKYVQKMLPGNIYLFWGYRTLHANFSVDHEFLRSTILFHCGDVHRDSMIDRSIKKIRHNNEITNLNEK